MDTPLDHARRELFARLAIDATPPQPAKRGFRWWAVPPRVIAITHGVLIVAFIVALFVFKID